MSSGVNFTDVPDDDITLAVLIKLGYKGPLYKHTNIENVDYPELIWEDLAYQIDHRKEKRSRREDYLEYGLSIPETMLTEAIKQSESYQMFIKYSTKSEPEPESVKRKTFSKRRVKKKVTLSADDNIIFDDPNTALEIGKSISQTEAEEAEAARQGHVTHARIVTESVPESTKKKSGGRSSKSVVIQDTPSAPKSKPATSKTKLKGALSLTLEEQEAADIMKALKEIVSATSSEGTGTKPGVPDEEKEITEENVILEWGSEQESEYSEEDKLDDEEKDDKEGDANDEDDETESDEDDIYKYKIRMRKDEDDEMINAEVDDSDKGDEEITDATKADAEKTSEDTTDIEINSLLEVKIQSEVPHTQSVSVVFEPIVPKPVQESPSTSTATTLPPLSVSTTPFSCKIGKTKLKTIDHSTKDLAILKSQVPMVVDSYLDSKVGDVFQKELQKYTANLIQKYSLQHLPEITKKLTPTTHQEEVSMKRPLDILKIKKEQAEKQ
ncbi:hypothetical protein Tco_0871175 [Tanacetum coccineum]